MHLPILFQDEHYVAIHKPSGYFVHRNAQAPHEKPILQMLRDQIGAYVNPVHRIDRATSGVLLFALHAEATKHACTLFEQHDVRKEYLAVLRGHIEEDTIVDKPIITDGKEKPAMTKIELLSQKKAPYPQGPFQETWYSIVKAIPETGRRHQIRKHCRTLRHPIIGDTTYGDNTSNKHFRAHFDVQRMLLMSWCLDFVHPYTEKRLRIKASIEPVFQKLMDA